VLTLSDSGADVTSGTQAYGTIIAKNVGKVACSINGYPGVTVLINHQPAPTKLSRAPGSQPRKFTLTPGGLASFGFSRSAQHILGHCDQIDGFRVFDPDGSGYRSTGTAYINCGESEPSPVVVGPFEPGSHASIG
jgi:hypothetical protein